MSCGTAAAPLPAMEAWRTAPAREQLWPWGAAARATQWASPQIVTTLLCRTAVPLPCL